MAFLKEDPSLAEGRKFFSNEPFAINVVSLFYDKKCRADNLNTHAPGFFGSGIGVVPWLGYAKKFDVAKIKGRGNRRHVHFHHLRNDRWTPYVAIED